jgi:hypothetical protein
MTFSKRKFADIIIYMVLVLSLFFIGCHKNKTIKDTNSDSIERSSSCTYYYLTNEQRTIISKKAINGDANAAYRLATYCSYCGCSKGEGLKWILIATENGHEQAEAELRAYYRIQPDSQKKDIVFWLKKAAESGHVWSLIRLANLYENGNGVGKNHKKAKKLYEKAALMGDKDSMIKMIEFLSLGKGGTKDLIKAYAWALAAFSYIDMDSSLGKIVEKKRISIREELNKNDLTKADQEMKIILKKLKKGSQI